MMTFKYGFGQVFLLIGWAAITLELNLISKQKQYKLRSGWQNFQCIRTRLRQTRSFKGGQSSPGLNCVHCWHCRIHIRFIKVNLGRCLSLYSLPSHHNQDVLKNIFTLDRWDGSDFNSAESSVLCPKIDTLSTFECMVNLKKYLFFFVHSINYILVPQCLRSLISYLTNFAWTESDYGPVLSLQNIFIPGVKLPALRN